jgi:hypothetical protein
LSRTIKRELAAKDAELNKLKLEVADKAEAIIEVFFYLYFNFLLWFYKFLLRSYRDFFIQVNFLFYAKTQIEEAKHSKMELREKLRRKKEKALSAKNELKEEREQKEYFENRIGVLEEQIEQFRRSKLKDEHPVSLFFKFIPWRGFNNKGVSKNIFWCWNLVR